MFEQDGVRNAYPRLRKRRGWGRVLILTAALLVIGGRLAYSSGPVVSDRVVVAPGDTVWSIAARHYQGDPRPHVEAILAANHLRSPMLTPGQTLQIPRE
jgi:nucleoid-associated protein YgaU